MIVRSALLVLCAVLLPAVEVRLAGPLTTTVDLLADMPLGDALLTAEVAVSDDAPADLQVAAFSLGDDGSWRQSVRFQPLPPGRHSLALVVPGRPGMNVRAIGGLVSCSAAPGGHLRIDAANALPHSLAGEQRLHDLAWDPPRVRPGQPWRLRLRPEVVVGCTITGTATAADGNRVALVVEPPAADGRWQLTFVPPTAGVWTVEAGAQWPGTTAQQRIEVVAEGPPPVATAPAPAVAGGTTLTGPLRSELARPVAEAAAAWRVTARLVAPADAAADLAVGAFVRDGDGGWRRSRRISHLKPGAQEVAWEVPAGGARGPGEAGLALWTSGTSPLAVDGLTVRAVPLPAGDPGFDRLRLTGLAQVKQGLQVAVGKTWELSLVPMPDDPRCLVQALVSVAGGEPVPVPARRDADGRHHIAFHPSLPGSCRVELIGRWSDGRTRSSVLPPVVVVGEHPNPGAAQLTVRGPLVRVVPLPGGALEAIVLVPDGAPADLSAAQVAIDSDDRWFQSTEPQALHPGINRLRCALTPDAVLAAAPGNARWDAAAQDRLRRRALAITTASAAPVRVQLGLVEQRQPPPPPPPQQQPSPSRLSGLTTSGAACTGERWTLGVRPEPFPANPYEPDEFRLDLEVVAPDGSRQQLPGFCTADMAASDRGDREEVQQASSSRFAVRWRPRQPGRYGLTVMAAWRDGAVVRCALPEIEVAGAVWEGYARVDRQDPRFFAADGRFLWPNGPNLRSVWDVRARDRMHTRLTPDRGSLAYDAYLERFAAGGANACEIWLSAWNLALEWRADWPGFAGVGRYNLGNAWRLDHILDTAWAHGVRVNLVINNHGQASERTDTEWASNPYNRLRGGQLTRAQELFSDPWALRGQANLRRYLIARYADHPAVLGWKLWTEINLTNGGPLLRPWHEQAVQLWHAEDAYGHPVATHWSGDYRSPDHAIAEMMDYLCIDAYHDDKPENPYRLVHLLLRDSTLADDRGLARLARPLLVTEYGGNWSGTRNDALMEVDHGCGAWTALVSGHAGGPMLWWFEWIDQGRRFAPYAAMRRFIAGEDLRGGRSQVVVVDPASRLWAGAWRMRGTILGYCLDETWAADGITARPVRASLSVAGLTPGAWGCEWWDADTGEMLSRTGLTHTGGDLRLAPPVFTRHLAWKLKAKP